MRYTLYLEDLILPEDYAAHPDASRAITERYTWALERLVRRHPPWDSPSRCRPRPCS
jgi:hypothetical protein